MLFSEPEHAADYLRRIGYYRLSGYWKPFIAPDNSENFSLGTTFSDVLALYLFDKRLRLILLDALERIEITFRAEISYHMGSKDRLAHQNKQLLNPKPAAIHYDKWLSTHSHAIERSRAPFVRHHRDRYDGKMPIWAASELWSFGGLSKFYSMMRRADQHVVADRFGVEDAKLMANWLHAMTNPRNIAAHHGRLWNCEVKNLSPKRRFPSVLKPPMLPDGRSYHKLYPILCIMVYLVRQITPGSQWPHRLREMLLELNPKTGRSLSEMGFPPDWAQSPFWRQ